MKRIKYLSLIIGLLFVMNSCDDNIPQSFNAEDSYASFTVTSVAIDENTSEVLKIPIALAYVGSATEVKATVAVSVEGEVRPAVEGVDFTVENKEIVFTGGTGIEYVKINIIDNDVYEGKKTFKLIISQVTPSLKSTVQDQVLLSIIDDEHPWKALFGEYSVEGISAFDDLPYSGEVIFISPSDEDDNVLNVDFGYSADAKMNVGEIDGEIVVSIKDNQYIGPTPKLTTAWSPYFRATHIEGESLFFADALTGVFENGTITCEYGFGVQAIHPTTGASGGYFQLSYDNIKFVKK